MTPCSPTRHAPACRPPAWLLAALLIAAALLQTPHPLRAFEAPDLGPSLIGGQAHDNAALPAYKVTQIAKAEKGFKTPTRIQVAFTLPDEPLTPGKLNHATVTWTVAGNFHLNGPLPGDPAVPYSTFRLKANGLDLGPLSYTGTLLGAAEPGIAPNFKEQTVTADLPFRLNRGWLMTAGNAEIAAALEIDSSYCSTDGSCYLDVVNKRGGQAYTVTFHLSTHPAADADDPFPPARIPPFIPFGQTEPPTPPTPNTPPTPPTPTPPTPAPATGPDTEPPVGATSPAQLETPVPQGLFAILESDLTTEAKVRALYDQGGLVILLLFIGLSGVLTTALPCTYPLIPITARILGARAANREPQPGDPTRGDAFSASLFYMFGLTLIYGIIGAIGASASLLITNLNNATWFNLAIALLFGVLALGMFGLFEIKMPNFIATRLSGGKPAGERKHGLVSNAIRGLNMGLLAAILAGACTAPVMISALLLVGSLKLGVVKGFLILAPFGFGFGLPYFLLTNFIPRLPAPGQWMELVKIVFGTAILLTGFYYWDKTLPNATLYWLALGGTLLAVGVSFGALDRLEPPVAASQRVRQLATVGLLIVGAYFVMVGLEHATGRKQPPAAGQTATPEIPWESYTTFDPDKPDGSGRPVYIFFHAPSCYYCNKMLATGFKDAAVIELSKKIRMIDADAHFDSDQLAALQAKYGYSSQPHSVFLDAAHQPVWGDEALVRGYIDTAGLLKRFKLLTNAGRK